MDQQLPAPAAAMRLMGGDRLTVGTVIEGDLDLRGASLPAGLWLDALIVHGDVLLDGAEIGIGGSLDRMRCANLSVRRVRVLGTFSLKAARISGDVDARQSMITGDLAADDATIEGSLLLSGTDVAGAGELRRLAAERVDLAGASFGELVSMEDARIGRHPVFAGAALSGGYEAP